MVSPGLPFERRTDQRLSRQDKAAFVEFDGSFEPSCVGLRADKDVEGSRREGPACARAVVLDHTPVQAIHSYELLYLGVREQLDVLGLLNTLDEYSLAVAVSDTLSPVRSGDLTSITTLLFRTEKSAYPPCSQVCPQRHVHDSALDPKNPPGNDRLVAFDFAHRVRLVQILFRVPRKSL